MFDKFGVSFTAVMAVYGIIVIGMLCRKYGAVSKEVSDTMLKLVVNLFSPCLIVSKVLSNEAFHEPMNIYLPPLAGIALATFGIAFAWLWAHTLPHSWTGLDTPQKKGTFAACIGMFNYGYVPIPLCADLFPGNDRILAILFVFNVGVEFVLWTVVVLMFLNSLSWKMIKRGFNIPVITIIITMLLNITHLDSFVPTIAYKSISMLGAATIPLSLFFVGATIIDSIHPHDFIERHSGLIRIAIHSCLLRLLILPALFVYCARLRPCSHEIKVIIVIQASMASAIFPIVMSRVYNGNVKTAIITVFSNSLLAIITTSLWIAIGF